MMAELQVLVYVRVTVSAPLEQGSSVWITRTGICTRTGVSVNVA